MLKPWANNFAFLWYFALCLTISTADDSIIAHPSDKVKLRIINGKRAKFVRLRRTDSFLANENLPVWTVQKIRPDSLIPNYDIMNAIGQFTMYQSRSSSAAAVYFHKLNKFYGTIDVRFIIKGITIEAMNDMYIPGTLNFIMRNSSHHGHRTSRSHKNSNSSSPINLFKIDQGVSDGRQSEMRLRRDLPSLVYVPILVIVSYELQSKIEQEFQGDIGTLHNLLILFNSVDMLFSKLIRPSIKINIAGVIIGTDPESFPAYSRCYKGDYISGKCINSVTEFYLHKYSDVISPESYHTAIFLTSYGLGMRKLFSEYSLGGLTSRTRYDPYTMRKYGLRGVPVISVHHQEYFGSFGIVAHELMHSLGGHFHDAEPYLDKYGNCCTFLMHPVAYYCKECLSWSPFTKNHLRTFFSSRNRCFFLHKPRSLQKPGPTEVWTADEQCQCYGYDFAATPRRSRIERICRIAVKEMCKANLRCYDHNQKSHRAPLPLDGTFCGLDDDGSRLLAQKMCTTVRMCKMGNIRTISITNLGNYCTCESSLATNLQIISMTDFSWEPQLSDSKSKNTSNSVPPL